MSCPSLPARLSAISKMVPIGSSTADIGTDHAFLPIYLIKNKIASSVIASDIVDGPLKSAEKNINSYGLKDEIKLIKSDGLDNVYPFTPETVIIAGMGSETIRDIISSCNYSKEGHPLFILQPMTHTEILRDYLFKEGFSILEEIVIREINRFYVIIKAKYSENQKHYFNNLDCAYDCLCMLGGITKDSSKDSRDYLLWRKQTAEKALLGLKNSKSEDLKETLFTNLIEEINKRL